MLLDKYPSSRLPQLLVDREDFAPYPTAHERCMWEELPETVQSAHILAGDDAIEKNWPRLPAALFLEYDRTGNRRNYEKAVFGRRHILSDLVIAYCIEPEERYLDPIVNAIWSTCEESFWGIPAHLYMQEEGPGLPDTAEPTVDLFAAETGALLAWTNYLLGPSLDEMSPHVRSRVRREVRKRVLQPCMERDDFWWMGFEGNGGLNNWNPWINSNWLTCALLLVRETERRTNNVARIMKSLDAFIDNYPSDGGCDEGPGYWQHAAGSLFDCLDLLHTASDGEINVYDEALIAEMARYIYRVHIHDRWFVNFADASAVCEPSGSLIHNFGRRVEDEDMMEFGTYLAETCGFGTGTVGGSMGRRLRGLFSLEEVLGADGRQPCPRDTWLPETQVMVSRDAEGSAKGFLVGAKGGHNAESHNHNDVGHFVVFVDGKPLLIDVGVETYRRKTFSCDRYDIWTMQSDYHNLPTVDGYGEASGKEHRAEDVDCRIQDSAAELTMDLGSAYPESTGIDNLRRSVCLNRGKNVEVTDEWILDHEPDELVFSLLTPCLVEDVGNGRVTLGVRRMKRERESAGGTITYDADQIRVEVQPIPLEDSKLKLVWGETIHRLVFHTEAPEKEGKCRFRILP